MPYVDKEARRRLESDYPQSAGELNYVITKALFSGLTNSRLSAHLLAVFEQYVEDSGLSYQTLNDIMGACSGAVFEHTRRKGRPHQQEVTVIQILRDFYNEVAGPYENTKIASNGDIPGYEAQQN